MISFPMQVGVKVEVQKHQLPIRIVRMGMIP